MKPDLYSHQHDASIQKEIDNFNSNFKELDNVQIDHTYSLSNDHIYNNK